MNTMFHCHVYTVMYNVMNVIWALVNLWCCMIHIGTKENLKMDLIVERQNGKRGLESGFGSAGYVNGF